jgi:hypothetical protein
MKKKYICKCQFEGDYDTVVLAEDEDEAWEKMQQKMNKDIKVGFDISHEEIEEE